jgi:hypothetical protein
MSKDYPQGHHSQFVSDLAKSTGIGDSEVAKVLEALGLSQTLREAEQHLGQQAVQSIRTNDLKVSVRIGRLAVAV